MIIGSSREMAIGAIHGDGLTDDDGEAHWGMPCRIVREATLDEWIASARNAGCAPAAIARVESRALFARLYFYEVAVD